MRIPVSEYRDWVDKRNDPPDRKKIAHDALDAYEALASRDHIGPEDVAPIVAAATNKYLTVWDVGTVFLVRLAESHDAAREAMLKIMESKKAHERSQIIWALTARLPEDFRAQMIRKAINDRAKRVRMEAAAKTDLFRHTELIPDLEACLEIEEDPEVQHSLQFHIAMLRDGYIIEDLESDSCRLTVAHDRGWATRFIPTAQAEGDSLAAMVREMASRDV